MECVILVIDDDPDTVEFLNILFLKRGYEVLWRPTVWTASNWLDNAGPAWYC